MSKAKVSRKEKKKLQQLAAAAEQRVKYDVVQILRERPIDTKPNLAKFLKEYVGDIRATVDGGKIQFYPEYRHRVNKVIVHFLDGHDAIFCTDDKLPDGMRYFLYDGIDEIELGKAETDALKAFFAELERFGFFR